MTSDATAEFSANPEQAEYWNTLIGPKWVLLQAEIDQHLAPLNAMLTKSAGVASGHKVIDVGCGTGDLALHLAEVVGPTGAVLGADLSAPMLALAERRRAERGYGHLRFQQVDAQTHAFEPAAYDLALSRFGVMFFGDPVAAFRNVRRALRPSGRLAFVCWAPIEKNPWLEMPMQVGVRWLGPAQPQPPRAPGPFAFSEAAYVEQILGAAGYANIELAPVETVLPGAPTAAQEADFVRNMGPLARLIREREPDEPTVRRIVDDVAKGFRPFETDAGVRVPALVWYVTAVRP